MRLRALLTAVALMLGLVAVAAAPAQATETALSATASPLWQTNATVRAVAAANGKIFVGGEFTSVRPPGSALGAGEVARTYLAAFDATTGALITSFNPVLNGMVWALTPSPDGSTIYVGGDFTTVSGAGRSRVARFDTTTGALSTSFKPVVSWRVANMAAFGSRLYVVGSFGAVDGVTRNRAAAVDATTGALLAFDPNVTSDPNAAVPTAADVAAVAVSKDGTKIYLGGRFTTVGGTPSYAMAAVDSASGALLPFPARSAVPTPTSACTSGVRTIVTDATTVYAGAAGDGGGCFDGTFAANVSDGSLKWRSNCFGATEALALIKGWLYKGSHTHDCSSSGAIPQGSNHFLLVQRPGDGSIGPWAPQTNAAGATQVGPMAFATDGSQLVVGGDFTQVNGVGQQGITRFAAGPETAPVKPRTPTALSPDSGMVKVNVRLTTDLDDENLTYRLYRNGTTAPIATWTQRSTFWMTPNVQYVDSGLTPGSQVSYRVEATDGTAVVSSSSTPNVTVASSRQPYATVVAADAPVDYWRLDETSGSTANDSGQAPNPGTYTNVTLGQPGALSSGVGTAASFNGSTSMVASTSGAQSSQTFSVEAWIKTTTVRGGQIVGYGNSQTGSSTNYDRHLDMANDGRILFGVYNGTTYTIRSGSAYNNGKWHHVVGTFQPGSQALYVDGVLQGTTTAPLAQGYVGFWRIGKDSVAGWPYAPTSAAFAGTIDEVAVYGWALTSQAVLGHYVAGGGSGGNPAAPALVNDSASTPYQTQLTVAAPGVLSNDSGSGLSATSSTQPSHGTATVDANGAYRYTPAAGFVGTDSFTYTVTDSLGRTATATVTITVTTPAAPVANPDSVSTAVDTPVTRAAPGVLSNDSGTGLTVSSSTSASHGTASVASNGSFTYTPKAGYSGSDAFTYTVADTLGRVATATVSVTVGVASARTFLQDDFTRTVTGGWGSAPVGGTWGPASSALSVNGSAGVIRLAAGQIVPVLATGAGAQSDVTATTSFSLDALPTGSGQYTSLVLRRASTSVLTEYRGTVRVQPNGKVTALIYRLVSGASGVVVGSETVITGLTAAPGTKLSVEFSAIGSSPTALSLTVWATGSAQPATPQITATDSASALQGSGLVGVVASLSGSATASDAVRYDEVHARTPS